MYDIYEHDRRPTESVDTAGNALAAAAHASDLATQHLLNAQAAISHQGINDDNAGNLRRRPTLRLAPTLQVPDRLYRRRVRRPV